MSRLRMGVERIGRIPTLLRTLAHLQPAQARAQLHHAFFGLPVPRKATTGAPTLAISRPHTPFLEPPRHVRSLGEARIELLNVPFDLAGGIDWATQDHGPLFAYHLHQHEYLRLSSWTERDRAMHLRDWIQNSVDGVGWDPHPISLRSMCWGKMLLTSGLRPADERLCDEMLASLSDQLETLVHGLEIRLQANHLLSNLIAVVFGGLLLDGESSSVWREQAESLQRELDSQIYPDGGHEERSPMYHSLLLESLLDLLNLCRAAPSRVPSGLDERLREVTSRMLGALEFWTHADGEIALFADSAFDVAADPNAIRAYADRLGVDSPTSTRCQVLPQTGYLRLRAGEFDLIASVAGPSPAHQPGHAHCDALAFELSISGARFVTDTGLFEYRPGARRDRARATASHATLQIDGAEQAETWAAHRIGGRPRVELTAWDESGSAEATCRGWSRGASLHRRFFSVQPDGVTIVDRVEGPSREVRIQFPFDPAWQVERLANRVRATRESEDSQMLRVEIELMSDFEWALERQPYYPRFGCEVARFVLVGIGTQCAEMTTRIRLVD